MNSKTASKTDDVIIEKEKKVAQNSSEKGKIIEIPVDTINVLKGARKPEFSEDEINFAMGVDNEKIRN